jgi:hypothetical protein
MDNMEKVEVQVRITTTKNVIYGTISKTSSSRTLDLLNSKHKFIAITGAVVIDGESSKKQNKTFIAINTTNIVSVEEM